MNRRPNHIAADIDFIIVCMVAAIAIYLALTADRRDPGNVTAAQPAIANTVTADIEATGGADETPLKRDPDHLEYAGEMDEAPSSAPTDSSAATLEQQPIASSCRGYWVGKDFAVTLLPSRGGMVASLYLQEPRSGDANPPVEAVTTANPPYLDYQGSYDADHLSVAFANIASIDMTCGEKRAARCSGSTRTRSTSSPSVGHAIDPAPDRSCRSWRFACERCSDEGVKAAEVGSCLVHSRRHVRARLRRTGSCTV